MQREHGVAGFVAVFDQGDLQVFGSGHHNRVLAGLVHDSDAMAALGHDPFYIVRRNIVAPEFLARRMEHAVPTGPQHSSALGVALFIHDPDFISNLRQEHETTVGAGMWSHQAKPASVTVFLPEVLHLKASQTLWVIII